MSKKKILFIYNYLFHYRIPFWNKLSEKYDLTVGYSLGSIPEGIPMNFKTYYFPIHKIGRFVFHKDNLKNIAKEYDCVVAYGEIAWISLMLLPLKGVKTIFHNIGVSASYKNHFDANKKWDRVRDFFYSKASALAFYTDYPIKKAERQGRRTDNLFVAPNTVEVIKIMPLKKESILFIGTLYREKGLGVLLESYLRAKKELSQLPSLKIIGDGPDRKVIQEWIKVNNLEKDILLLGSIYDVSEKAKHFASALVCISPKQAGLSVLESMGYGVPFVSSKNAITGGEIFNINSGENGILMNDDSELKEIIKQVALEPEVFIKMGRNAKKYYDACRTINHMAKGMSDAIEYAISKNNYDSTLKA